MEHEKRAYYNCSVYGCLNSTSNCELSFFKLPSTSERRTEWLKLIDREDLIESRCFYARVCEAHFTPNSVIVNSKRKLLKKNAIPQLLLPTPNNFVPATIKTDASIQCNFDNETVDSGQTPSNDTPGKTKQLREDKRYRRGLKIINYTQPEFDMFLKLCDKFLNPRLARVVKRQAKIKFLGRNVT